MANGIKLNAATYLAESHDGAAWLRVLLKDGYIARIGAHDPEITTALEGCIGTPIEPAVLQDRLARRLAPRAARAWAWRIGACLAGVRDDDDSVQRTGRWPNRP